MEAVRTIARNRRIVFTTTLALIVGSLVVSPRPALSQTAGDCLTSTASGNWRLAAEICERLISDLLDEMMPPSGCNLWPRGCPTPDWLIVAESELAYSEVTEAEALIETHYGHLKLAEYWLGQALHGSKDLAQYSRDGPSAIIYAMVPKAKALASRQTAELAALEKRMGLASPTPKPRRVAVQANPAHAATHPHPTATSNSRSAAVVAAARPPEPSASTEIPRVELPAGTPVTLAGDGSVSSSSGALVGAYVMIYAAQDVKVDGWTAIPRCAVGRATVVDTRAANRYESGKLIVSAQWIESADGKHISLSDEPFTLVGDGDDVTLDSAHSLLSHTSQDAYSQRSKGSTPAYHGQPSLDGGLSANDESIECHNREALNASPTTASSGGPQAGVPVATSNAPGDYGPNASPQGQSVRVQGGDRWAGVIDDARGGRGQLMLSFSTATTPNGSPSGDFEALFGGDSSNWGDITGLEQRGAALSFYLQSRRQPSCVYRVSASIGQDGVMRGSYQGCSTNTSTFYAFPLQRGEHWAF